MIKCLKNLICNENGQSVTEYGLVLGVIAVSVMAAIISIRLNIIQLFENVTNAVQSRE